MNNDTDNILPNDADAGKEKLLQELNDNSFSEEAFEKDSAEGLSGMAAPKIPLIVEQLNANLHQQLRKKKRKRKALPDQSFIVITVIIVLLLIVVAWVVIRKLNT